MELSSLLGGDGDVLLVVVDDLLDGLVGLLGERLVLEHWDVVSFDLSLRELCAGNNLQKANSSRVRPAVSGKRKYTKTISKHNQQQ